LIPAPTPVSSGSASSKPHALSYQRTAEPIQDTGLTERELDVLRVLAAGSTEREAAAALFISPSTIHSHTKSIYFKLRSSRAIRPTRAYELGLIDSV
jgi:DNA-binding NarL/FixJ family response regulator